MSQKYLILSNKQIIKVPFDQVILTKYTCGCTIKDNKLILTKKFTHSTQETRIKECKKNVLDEIKNRKQEVISLEKDFINSTLDYEKTTGNDLFINLTQISKHNLEIQSLYDKDINVHYSIIDTQETIELELNKLVNIGDFWWNGDEASTSLYAMFSDQEVSSIKVNVKIDEKKEMCKVNVNKSKYVINDMIYISIGNMWYEAFILEIIGETSLNVHVKGFSNYENRTVDISNVKLLDDKPTVLKIRGGSCTCKLCGSN
jgi:hypothetical protein